MGSYKTPVGWFSESMRKFCVSQEVKVSNEVKEGREKPIICAKLREQV
jgi:hypothetical protein